MKFENTQVYNFDGAMRGMRFPLKSVGDTIGDVIGPNDMKLAKKLCRAGELDNRAHSKFLRQVLVSVDISAPLYFWQEMDTYKIGTTANSESTMHKLTKDAFQLTLADFEYDNSDTRDYLREVIKDIREIAEKADNVNDIATLRRLKQMLPTSYIQKRHWTANYEVLHNIYKQRKNHRLSEWHYDFYVWVKKLPYAQEFIVGTYGEDKDENIIN